MSVQNIREWIYLTPEEKIEKYRSVIEMYRSFSKEDALRTKASERIKDLEKRILAQSKLIPDK